MHNRPFPNTAHQRMPVVLQPWNQGRSCASTLSTIQPLRCISMHPLTQPCLTAYCMWCNISMIRHLPSSASQCILGKVYVRQNPSRSMHSTNSAISLMVYIADWLQHVKWLAVLTLTVCHVISRIQQLHQAFSAHKGWHGLAAWVHTARKGSD